MLLLLLVSQIKTGAHPDEKRIISRERRFNYVVSFFFRKMPKIWVGQTTLNREKRGWP